MGKDLIGKRITVKIGGNPPQKDDAIVGDDVTVYVPEEDVGKYQNITGEKVELIVSSKVDSIVKSIAETVGQSEVAQGREIVRLCDEIIAEKNENRKKERIKNLISIGSGIASISQVVLKLVHVLG